MDTSTAKYLVDWAQTAYGLLPRPPLSRHHEVSTLDGPTTTRPTPRPLPDPPTYTSVDQEPGTPVQVGGRETHQSPGRGGGRGEGEHPTVLPSEERSDAKDVGPPRSHFHLSE